MIQARSFLFIVKFKTNLNLGLIIFMHNCFLQYNGFLWQLI